MRPWQFGRYDHDPGGLGDSPGLMSSLLPVTLPYVLIPETTLLEDRNHIKALQTRSPPVNCLKTLDPARKI